MPQISPRTWACSGAIERAAKALSIGRIRGRPRRAARAALGLDLGDVTALLARIDDGAVVSENPT